MTIKVGINGFGRIGRSIFRASKQYKEFEAIEIEAINDLTNTQTLAHLLKYDSVMRTFSLDVQGTDQGITVDGKDIRITAIKEPSQLPWQEMSVEYVIEATGRFSDANLARGHLEAGAQKVVITAPAKHEDVTIVMGVNEDDYDPAGHHIVSNASCTTNCLAPMAKVILDRFGIVSGLITTVHAYTNDQRLPNVSIVDLVAQVEKRATVSEINEAIKAATNRFLGYTDEPLVSTDFMGDPRSSIVDGACTKVIQDNSIKVMSWYDNEWGYSNRILDLILHMNAHKAL
jgi:glyceraldehyde 3-phosphate dehydrogenase